MNFTDIMVIITGLLCFLVGVLMVPMIESYLNSTTGFSIPAALTGVVNLILIIVIILIHTRIVLFNQKRKTRTGSEGVIAIPEKRSQSDKE